MKQDGLFELAGRVAVVTGGGGVLGGAMAGELARRGVKTAILDLSAEAAERAASASRDAGGEVIGLSANVLEPESLEEASARVLEKWGQVDILVNGAGGNKAEATVSEDRTFFDLPPDALRAVIDLNLIGTIIPSQVFGRAMARQESGCIVNISSMNAFRPLTRILGYSAAKAAINNVTQWMAVYMAQNISPHIRVNAMAPGFFETAQNRYLLRDESGEWTRRGRQIIEHTPQGRFGVPEDLLSTLVWLVAPGSSFVNGIVVPVDGGFSAFSGV